MPIRTFVFALAACGCVSALAVPVWRIPETIYAAPGLECNVYFKNVFESVVPQNFAFRAESKAGRSELKRWTWTPSGQDAGRRERVIFQAWNDDGLVAAATTTVRVAGRPVGAERKITLALLAASITNSRYQDQLYRDVVAAGYTNYTPVGTRGNVDTLRKGILVPFDGFGGFTFGTFLTRYKISDEEYANVQDAAEREQLKALGAPEKIVMAWQRNLLRSPLVQFRNGKREVDVQAWLDKINGGKAPDYIVIELGCNSAFSYVGEIPQVRKWFRKDAIEPAKKLLDTLRERCPDAVYGFCDQIVGCSQDGFAANYGAGWNEIQFRKTCAAMNREIKDFVDGLNDPKVRFIPFCPAIDPEGGYITAEVPVHAQSDVKVVRDANAVHPSAAGGKQLGDAVAAWLLNDLGAQ